MKKFNELYESILNESIPSKLRGKRIEFRGEDGNDGDCYIENVKGDIYTIQFVNGMYDGEYVNEDDESTYGYEDFEINSKNLKTLISGKAIKINDLVFELV